MSNLHGWIIYNGILPSEDFIDFAEWLHEASLRANLTTEIIANNEVLTYLSATSLDLIREQDQSLPDFVIFTDKDIYLARQLELLGVRVFNSADAIAKSDDKIITY